MPPQQPMIGTDAANSFEDLSGLIPKSAKASVPENPYDVLIEACNNDPGLIRGAYSTHRTTRNRQQRTKLLATDFSGVIVDKTLQELEYIDSDGHGDRNIPELSGTAKRSPAEIDPRNCLVFWARPTNAVKDLVGMVQEKLQELAPDIWLMPRDNLHMTVLEITHSKTPETIAGLVAQMQPSLQEIVDWPREHRTVLVKPMLSYDAAALAISFVPAADGEEASYTYHHLRRDFYKLGVDSGVVIASRYTVPSAHITIGRFVTTRNHAPDGPLEMERWVERIEEVNRWLEEEWAQFRWVVGEERGIDCRIGRLWYGGGESVVVGEGF